ncbi:MAG: hypothetical protein IT196_02635 [Acidimicrobiales bacterium]|nr:hypothetical protein [Acidimicrobiales bacterium]
MSALLMAMAAAVLALLASSPASAQSGAQTPSPVAVTDYANYPLGLGIIPGTCTTQGSGILTGTQYSMNGGAPVGSLAELGQVPGDAVITMTWTGYAPGCEGIGVSLSRKVALTIGFNEADNQYLNVWSYCGPQGNACNGSLTLNLGTSATSVTCYQLDANVGPPLEIVGPGGSFYSMNGRFNTLLSANNGGSGDCTPPPCPAPNAPVDMPAAAAACQQLQVTTTTTTSAPTSTTAPAVTTSAGSGLGGTTTSTAPCASGQSRNAAGQCVAVLDNTARALPFTGSPSADMARFGAVLLAAGGLAVLAAKRLRTSTAG